MLIRYVAWVIEANLVLVDESNVDQYRSQRRQGSLLGGAVGEDRTLLWMDYEHAGAYQKFVSDALKPASKGGPPRGCGYPLIVEVSTGGASCRGLAEMLRKHRSLCVPVPAPPLDAMARYAARLGLRDVDQARSIARQCEGDVRAMELRIRMGAGSSKDLRYDDMFGVVNTLESSTAYTDYAQEGVRQLIGTSALEQYLRPSIPETLEEWSTLDLYRYRGEVFDDVASRAVTLTLAGDLGGHRLSRLPIRKRDPMVVDRPDEDPRLTELRQALNKTFTCAR